MQGSSSQQILQFKRLILKWTRIKVRLATVARVLPVSVFMLAVSTRQILASPRHWLATDSFPLKARLNAPSKPSILHLYGFT